MAEDQRQQTRVLVINGQTIIVQGGAENNSLNEINTDLIQQALQEVSASTATVVDDSSTYITPDTQAEGGDNNNIVGLAILQGEQGETTTIQLTAEQAEALGLSFTNGEPTIKEEHADSVSTENMFITDASGGHHLIYTEGSLKDEHGFVFDPAENNDDACTKIVSVENDDEVDPDSGDVHTGAESLGVLSTPVSAFLGNNTNQPLSLIPQIVNGQVTYTVKIHEDEEKVISSDHMQNSNDFINDSVPVNTITTTSFQHSDGDNISSYVSTSVPSLSYDSSVATPVSLQTLSMGDYQTQNVEPGSILTDSQTNISYVILPSTSTSDESTVASKPSIPVQQVPSFVPFTTVASTKSVSADDTQGTGISEVYSTVTAVDTSGDAPVEVVPKSVMGIPLTSVGSDMEPVVSGTISSITGSLTGGLIRVVSTNDRSLLQPNNSGAKFTSILSSTGRLVPSVTSTSKIVSVNSAAPKPASVNSSSPKITVTYPRSFSGVTKVVSSATTTSSASQQLPVMSTPKIIVSQGVVSSASILPTSSTSSSSVSTSGASPLSTSSSGITKTSSLPTAVSTAKSLSSILASKVVSSSSSNSPRIITVSSQSRTLSGNLAPKIVTANSSGSKVVTVNSAGPKIITVNAASGVKTSSDSVSSVVSATLSKMPPAKSNSSKPLGSSENPIQLVQHGQTFHSMQSLSESQLRQIAAVLQQQNLDATSRSKNVLYDAETKTRIIYRVVYPEDLDIGDPGSPSDVRPSRGRGRRGRPPKSGWRAPGRGYDGRSVDMDLDEDRLLDDSNKGERKKHLPRTRSGRLSRPPRHMVKDYKRLHHLDFADADLDDSDGGYSDYQMSEHEEEEQKSEVKDLLPGLVVPKRKISSHFRCPTCQKIYLGHSRMARHFEAFPDHGSIEQIQLPPAPRPELKPDNGTVNGLMRPGPGRRRGKRRGPWAYISPEVRSQRRKIKLKEMLGTCSAEELAEVCGPMVAELLPLWDLLLLRVDSVRTDETYLATLLEEVQALLERLQATARDVLLPVEEAAGRRLHQLELQDKTVCALLDVPCGVYAVDDRCLRTRNQAMSFEDEPYAKRRKLMDDEDDDDDASEVDEKQVGSKKEADRESRVTSFSLDTQLPRREGDEDEDENNTTKADDAEEGSEYLLQTSHDVDAAGESDELAESMNTSSQSFSDPDQHTKALQTVDEIVNESLKNLEFGVDDMVQAPERSVSHRGDKSEKDAKFSGPSFHREIDLVAMGEGSRASCELEEALDDISDSKNTYSSQNNRKEKEVTGASKGRASFIGSSQTNSVASGIKFEKGALLPSLAEDENAQITASFSTSMLHKSAVCSDDQNSRIRTVSDEHDGYTDQLQEERSSEEAAAEPYDPEMALRAMGEGDQPDSPSKVDNLEYSPSVRMEVSEGEGEGTPTYVLTGIVEDNEDDSDVTQEQFDFHRDVNKDGVDFNSELALSDIKNDGEVVPASKSDKENCGSFIPEMGLVSGKGDGKTAVGRGEMAYHAQPHASVAESPGMFGPEEALAAMGEGDQGDKPATYQSDVDPLHSRSFQPGIGSLNSRQFQLQCGSEPDFMEVSLDESGPELDFDALGEEFGHNSRHS